MTRYSIASTASLRLFFGNVHTRAASICSDPLTPTVRFRPVSAGFAFGVGCILNVCCADLDTAPIVLSFFALMIA